MKSVALVFAKGHLASRPILSNYDALRQVKVSFIRLRECSLNRMENLKNMSFVGAYLGKVSCSTITVLYFLQKVPWAYLHTYVRTYSIPGVHNRVLLLHTVLYCPVQ